MSTCRLQHLWPNANLMVGISFFNSIFIKSNLFISFLIYFYLIKSGAIIVTTPQVIYYKYAEVIQKISFKLQFSV